ncbi:MAG TPA: hypothetical protein VJQ49_07405 [Casimicrobiaceae bacterium]|nr:hypothetical protein [Casimicrobiaceae bacterium]
MPHSLYRRHALIFDRWAGGGNGRTAMARVLGTIGSLKSARNRALPARPRELDRAAVRARLLEAGAPSRFRHLRRQRIACLNADLSWRRPRRLGAVNRT